MIKKIPLIFIQHIFIFLFLLFLPFVAFGREITTAWALNAGNINPHLYSPNQMYAQIMLYQPLIRFDGRKFVGEVAESWEISKDNKFIVVANYNCSIQTAISGEEEAINEAMEKLKEAGAKRVIKLNVS